MATSKARIKEYYVNQAKVIGQYIIDNADDIIGDINKVTNIHIETDINGIDVPTVDVTQSIYVPMGSE